MDFRFGACGVAVVCGVFLSTCAQSQQVKPGQRTPGPVVYLPRSASAPPRRAQSVSNPAVSPPASLKRTPASAPPPAAAAPSSARPNVSSSPHAGASAGPSLPPRPIVTPVAAPGSVPLSVATLSPTLHLPAIIREPPDAPPQILGVELSSPEARGGDLVLGTVQTSSNVASVEARIGTEAASMQKVGVGRFALSYRIPNLPFWMHKTYLIQIIARNTAGLSVSTAVPITIR